MACWNADTVAVSPRHHSNDPVNTPATVRKAVARRKPDSGASAAKIAANIIIVGGLVSVRRTELLKAKGQEPQRRLDENPQAMRVRRETVEHPFGTLKMRMGATHFLMKRLPKVATEMALHVLAYNLTRLMNILGVKPLIAAIQT